MTSHFTSRFLSQLALPRMRTCAAYTTKAGKKARSFTTKSSFEMARKIVTIHSTTFARRDGGFGGPSEGMPKPHRRPRRAPERSIDIPIQPDQALIYHLSGDRIPYIAIRNPAAEPVLPTHSPRHVHVWLTCRAVLQTYADYDPSAFHRHRVGFSAPVFPGEIITVNLWKNAKSVRSSCLAGPSFRRQKSADAAELSSLGVDTNGIGWAPVWPRTPEESTLPVWRGGAWGASVALFQAGSRKGHGGRRI